MSPLALMIGVTLSCPEGNGKPAASLGPASSAALRHIPGLRQGAGLAVAHGENINIALLKLFGPLKP